MWALNESAESCFCGQLLRDLCLAEDTCHSFRASVAQQDCPENNLGLHVDSIALVLFPWIEQVSDSRYACTALWWAEELTGEIQESPSSPEEHCAHVPALLPGPP